MADRLDGLYRWTTGALVYLFGLVIMARESDHVLALVVGFCIGMGGVFLAIWRPGGRR